MKLLLPIAAALLALASPTVKPPAPAPAPPVQEQILEILRGYVGMREVPKNSNRGPLIDEFNRSAGVPLGSPYCAACAHYVYGKVGLKGQGAWSPSWYSKSRVVPADKVQPGDVALVYFPSKKRYAHTIAAVEKVVVRAGRVVEVVCIEANTSPAGSRDGDGVYRRTRSASSVTFVRWWNTP